MLNTVPTADAPKRIAILGASGYTGAELVRLLSRHPAADIRALTAERQAGKPLREVFCHLAPLNLPDLVRIGDVDWSEIDFVFCALPHGTTQEIIKALPSNLRIVDLSADFRLADIDSYAEWYGHAHQAPELQQEAVYGLTELNRQGVRTARLVANPGCYPTAALVPLLPLLLDSLVEAEDIIIDAKSGVSGAGRDAKQQNLFCEVSEGMHAYGVGKHRHMPEMEQELTLAAGRPVTIAFTPHLIPMNRGEFITTYVRLAGNNTAADLRAALGERYRDEPFVHVLPEGVVPHTRHVRGSNQVHISVFQDRLPGRAIVLSVLDNLVKGASGQAVQNMNVMSGLIETLGLEQAPLLP
jgi:N-acetyl-gamma-glutamyl-phosphate reductase